MLLASLMLAWSLTVPQAAPDYEKMRILSESVLGKRPATDAEIRELLGQALKDPHPRIRREAVGTLGTILTFSKLAGRPPAMEWTVRLRDIAEALRPALAQAVDDTDAQVRREALRALLSERTYQSPGPLPLAMLRMLATHYDKYDDSSGRAFIVSALHGSFQSGDAEARALALQILREALREQDPYLVQAAGLSATRAAAPEMLPLLVAQLKNPSHVARMGVAQGIASYRAAARPYLPQLEAALAAETDDITRKTLAGTISAITK